MLLFVLYLVHEEVLQLRQREQCDASGVNRGQYVRKVVL